MPNYLSNSIEIEGRYYCWDEVNNTIYEVDIKLIPVEHQTGRNSPGEAIKTLILQKTNRLNKGGDYE